MGSCLNKQDGRIAVVEIVSRAHASEPVSALPALPVPPRPFLRAQSAASAQSQGQPLFRRRMSQCCTDDAPVRFGCELVVRCCCCRDCSSTFDMARPVAQRSPTKKIHAFPACNAAAYAPQSSTSSRASFSAASSSSRCWIGWDGGMGWRRRHTTSCLILQYYLA